MILGVGVDAVAIRRMAHVLGRTPRVADRLFTAGELTYASTRGSPAATLAARFAAKEACRKALREILPWRDVEVVAADDGAPQLHVNGRNGVRFHVSLTHTADVAVAVVVAERPG